MNILDFLTGSAFGKVLDKFFPDAGAKQQAQLQILQMQQAGEFKALDIELQNQLAQIAVNNTEAASPSFWKSGARPAVLWICVAALFYDFLAFPMLTWYATIVKFPVPPALDSSMLLTILGGLLGVSTQRCIERLNGKA